MIRVVKPNVTATATVMRLRFVSATVELAAVELALPPNMSDTPPPLPLCSNTRPMSPNAVARWMIPTKMTITRS